jgi:hypothetical protein
MRTRAARQMAQFTWDRIAERLEVVSRAGRKTS